MARERHAQGRSDALRICVSKASNLFSVKGVLQTPLTFMGKGRAKGGAVPLMRRHVVALKVFL